MRAAILFFSLLSISISAVCQSTSADRPYVLLVSFDGFRHDYISKYPTPNFNSIVSRGAHASAMIPSFPSKTFPNHYSIVTGMYPGHHGLVDNGFFDPARRQVYGMKDQKVLTDSYYYGGTPIWALAKQHGLKSASFFWVGSECKDTHPDIYRPYDGAVLDTTRISEVFRWLSLPESERPHFISLYFSSPDDEGHKFGPAHERTKKAVMHADSLLGRIIREIAITNLPVNLIVVSDHGMKAIQHESSSYIYLDEILNMKDSTLRVSNGGTQAHLYLSDKSKVDSMMIHLRKLKNHYSVIRRDSFPVRWRYDSDRAGDILMLAEEGYYMTDRDRISFSKTLKGGEPVIGVHGYDPQTTRDVWGIFFAQGPNIKGGIVLDPFENIHVYPLMARILQLPLPKDIDGTEAIAQRIYTSSGVKTAKRKKK